MFPAGLLNLIATHSKEIEKFIKVWEPDQLLPFNANQILFYCTTLDSSYIHFVHHFLIEKHGLIEAILFYFKLMEFILHPMHTYTTSSVLLLSL